MYLSTLLIDVGDNPDRPRPGRTWLRNMYRVHQRLCMAFPSAERKEGDRQFLKPYKDTDFPPVADELDVHSTRDGQRGFLFRIDSPSDPADRSGRCVLLVQSAKEPDWRYAFGLNPSVKDEHESHVGERPIGSAGYLLAARPEVKPLVVAVKEGQCLMFRLRANVTRRMAGGPFRGKRVGVGTNRALAMEWLWRKAESGGFRPLFEPNGPEGWDERWVLRSGWSFGGNRDEEQSLRFQWTQFDGLLEVANPTLFRQTIESGIGPAKAFGFGLLSVAPISGALVCP